MPRVKVDNSIEGTVLDDTIIDSEGRTLLVAGTILTKVHISSLIRRGITFVDISEEDTVLVLPEDIIKKELQYLLENEILRISPDQKGGNANDGMVQVSKRARETALKITGNASIVNLCVLMKLVDSGYLYNHAIETCALSLLVACAMQLDKDTVTNIGVAAILHDIGICDMPIVLSHTSTNKKQEALWKEHSSYGYHICKVEGFNSSVTSAIYNHHEYWNGKGFPQGIKGDTIPIGARIIAVCDTYNRLIKHENYPHYQAIEFLYGGTGTYFDPEVVEAFTHNLAVYPLGSMVKLSTGEIGTVINVRKNLGPRPIIKVYYNRVNRPLTKPKTVDLAENKTIFIDKIL